MDQAAEDLPAQLPEGVLADVLGRLAPWDLAVSRAVCGAWRAVVDGHGILRAELLPRSLAGILIGFHGRWAMDFLARPPVPGRRDFLAEGGVGSWSTVLDHCNGLLLLDDDYDDDTLHMLNPATRWRATLPPSPPPRVEVKEAVFKRGYLAYDPAASPHYQVFSIPLFGCHRNAPADPAMEMLEWPPATYILHLFSSATGLWEERSFAREGEAAGTVADMRHYWPYDQRNAIYREGKLFIHSQTDFLMRISLSSEKYHIIKPPAKVTELYMGKSAEGIHCASLEDWTRLRVWILNESCSPMEWVLKHDKDLLPLLMKKKLKGPSPEYKQQVPGPWVFQDISYYYKKDYVHTKATVKEEFVWDSDMSDDEEFDCSMTSEQDRNSFYYGYFNILGFHPYKEIIFLGQSLSRGLAYHLNSSAIQEVGNLYPKGYEEELPNEQVIKSSFPYTPCWIDPIAKREDLEDH